MAFSAIHDVVIEDRVVRIYSNGTGAPLLMLPDLGSSAAGWESLTARVCERDRQIVAVDLPGTGHCDPVQGSELPAFVDHVRALLDHLDPGPIDLVGHGFGGYLAVSVAATEPHRVRTLVLEHPIVPPRSGPPVSSRMSPSMAVSGALTTLRRGRIKQNVHGFARARTVLDQLSRADPAWWESLAGISAPTLVVGGGTDAGERAVLNLLAGAIPGAERADLAGSKRGHTSDPEAFATVMMAFVTR